jgi:hypothetical protein
MPSGPLMRTKRVRVSSLQLETLDDGLDRSFISVTAHFSTARPARLEAQIMDAGSCALLHTCIGDTLRSTKCSGESRPVHAAATNHHHTTTCHASSIIKRAVSSGWSHNRSVAFDPPVRPWKSILAGLESPPSFEVSPWKDMPPCRASNCVLCICGL